ncbi:MAG: hypothetical protein ACRCW2_03910 [Cellulosilyticaceae bacterium]
MRKSESYFLKDGKLDLSLLNEEVNVNCEVITYHTIKTIHEAPGLEGEQVEEGFKEKLYGSLETYQILREMGDYLSSDFLMPDDEEDLLIWNVTESDEEEAALEEAYEEKASWSELAEEAALEEVYEEKASWSKLAEEAALEEAYEEKASWSELAEEVALAEIYEEKASWSELAEEIEREEAYEGRADWSELAEEVALEETYEEKTSWSELESDEKVEGALDEGQVFAYQLSAIDQEIMRQYEQPDRLVGLEYEEKEYSTIEKYRAYQLKLLQGRVLTQDIFSPQGVQVGRVGERITAALLERAKREGALIKIILKYL